MGRTEVGRQRRDVKPYARPEDIHSPTSAQFPPAHHHPQHAPTSPGYNVGLTYSASSHSNNSSAADENADGTYSLEPDEFGSYQGFPSVAEYEEIQDAYLRNLSSRKQEKALISQAMYDSIHAVLMDPANTSYGTPQFRFWVRKMFVLACYQGEYTVTHEEKPVAAKEQIYQILVHCHGECFHGGRDKTCAQIKQYYSWIPKELVAQFVKACPTCVLKRSNNPKKFVAMLKDIGGAAGPDDEYIDYFTSPLKGRKAGRAEDRDIFNSGRKGGVSSGSSSGGEGSRFHSFHQGSRPQIRGRQAPPPLSLGDSSYTQHSQSGSSVYTPGSFDLSRRPSNFSSFSGQSTPLSAGFDTQYPNSAHGSDDGAMAAWNMAMGRHSGPTSHMHGRDGSRSASSAGFPASTYFPNGPSSNDGRGFNRHLMAPEMSARSYSDGYPSSNGGADFMPARSHPSLPSMFANNNSNNGSSFYSGFNEPAGFNSMNAGGFGGNTLPPLQPQNMDQSVRSFQGMDSRNSNEEGIAGERSNIIVKVEETTALLSADDDPIDRESPSRLGGQVNFGVRRQPAPLNLNVSSFNNYRGDASLLSAHSVNSYASAPPSATESIFGGSAAFISDRSCGPSSAVSATFPDMLRGVHLENAAASGLDMLSAASLGESVHQDQGQDEDADADGEIVDNSLGLSNTDSNSGSSPNRDTVQAYDHNVYPGVEN